MGKRYIGITSCFYVVWIPDFEPRCSLVLGGVLARFSTGEPAGNQRLFVAATRLAWADAEFEGVQEGEPADSYRRYYGLCWRDLQALGAAITQVRHD